jgi:iron(III) transport system substrate-binding protein
VPQLWRDAGGTWVAVGGRAQVLLIAVDELGDRGAPVRFTALTDPWLAGKVAIAAPIGGPSLAHFAALYQAWGEERMTTWLAGLKANRVQVLDNDDQVRAAVVSGKATVGILSSDEAAKAAASAAHVLVVYPNQKSIGTFVWPTALSVPKNAKHPEAAARLAERLGDKSTEQLLVARLPGYLPLRAAIPVPPGVRSAANLVVVAVEPARIVQEIARRKGELAAWTAQAREAAPQNGAGAPQNGAAAPQNGAAADKQ